MSEFTGAGTGKSEFEARGFNLLMNEIKELWRLLDLIDHNPLDLRFLRRK